MGLTRRGWLAGVASASASLLADRRSATAQSLSQSIREESLARFPGKIAMRLINDRPPCLETPWRYFQHDLTPNDAFYVRWHLAALPMSVNLRTWRLRIEGAVERPLELSMDELRRMSGDEVVAVNQCSGNSRSLFTPRVAGAQWRNGAMGNARWAGVSLAKLLRAAGLNRDAVDVAFDGLDQGPLASVPDFLKSLSIDHALEPDVIVALSMNGAPLPILNGFPARLIVPGWYATYWVKALARITVLSAKFDGYWMTKAYKIPAVANGVEDPKNLSTDLVPINRMNVRSFVTTPEPGSTLRAGRSVDVDGIAFDGGSGIRLVEVSADGGALGPRLCSARTSAGIRSAAGIIAGVRHLGASIASRSGPQAVMGKCSPSRWAGTAAGICATSSKRQSFMSSESADHSAALGPGAIVSRRQRFGLILVGGVGLIASVVAYFGTRDTWTTTTQGLETSAEAGVVATQVADADDASDLPDGPNRDEFQSSCLICHSVRLPLDQPLFGREKWAEIVHKMVASYGAPLAPDDEARVVDYLLAARPQEPQAARP